MLTMIDRLRNIEFPADIMGFSFTEYLVIFLGLIFAFAVAEFFISIGQLLKNRSRTTFYWEFGLWLVALMSLFVSSWYVYWLRLGYVSQSMLHFLFATLPNVMIFLIISAFFPRIKEEGEIDLKEQFLHNRKWFFGLFGFYWLINLIIEIILMPPDEQNALFGLSIHLLFAGLNFIFNYSWLRVMNASIFIIQILLFLIVF